MKLHGLSYFLLLSACSLAAQTPFVRALVPVNNWPAPGHIQRSQLKAARGASVPAFQLPGSVANDALIFVPVAPCRLADTRSGQGRPALGITPLLPMTPRALPVAGTCGIPASAEAYSLNVTVVPESGTPGGYLVVYPNPSTPVPVAASLTWNADAAFQTAAVVVASSPNGSVNFAANFTTDAVVDINGYYGVPTDALGNTAIGQGSMTQENSTMEQNTAFGQYALANAVSASFNTAVGYSALQHNMSGWTNTAVGMNAMVNNTVGGYNVAIGSSAMPTNVDGQENVAVGVSALQSLGHGANNTAVGISALYACLGSGNTALGSSAGINVTSGSYNIMIGNAGAANDDHAIRIGDSQTSAYIAGISSVNLSKGAAVVISSAGQLGVQSSSRRYKEDIRDMGDASSGLLRLRPVTFRYKEADAGGSKPLEFGLVAEEVAAVYPDLVIRDAGGRIESVEYQKLPAMLVNELQRQEQTIRLEREENRVLEARVAALEALVAKLAGDANAAGNKAGTGQ